MVHLQGLEPWTHWLRVSCSTSWAKGAHVYGKQLRFSFPCTLEKKKGCKFQVPSGTTFPPGPLPATPVCLETVIENRIRLQKLKCTLEHLTVQALGLLVSVNWIHYCTYISDLSTRSLRVTLPAYSCGISYLEVYFTLRCLQRLSHPYAATQLCSWRNNWCTGGTSNPVLSY